MRTELKIKGLKMGHRKERELTRRQVQMLDFIKERVRKKGIAPSMREISAKTGITSPNGVMYQLSELERKGWIARVENLSRAITVIDKSPKGIPLLDLLKA